MPIYSSKVKRKDLTVADQQDKPVTVSCPQPYIPGQTITEDEAHALNSLLMEKTRRRLNTVIMRRGPPVDLQEETDRFVYHYQFTSGSKSATYDPIFAEAIDLATKMVKARIAKNGQKVSQFTTAQIRAYAKQLIEQEPEIISQAKAEVERRDELARRLLSA